MDISPKNTDTWPTSTGKDGHQRQSRGKLSPPSARAYPAPMREAGIRGWPWEGLGGLSCNASGLGALLGAARLAPRAELRPSPTTACGERPLLPTLELAQDGSPRQYSRQRNRETAHTSTDGGGGLSAECGPSTQQELLRGRGACGRDTCHHMGKAQTRAAPRGGGHRGRGGRGCSDSTLPEDAHPSGRKAPLPASSGGWAAVVGEGAAEGLIGGKYSKIRLWGRLYSCAV